MTASSNSHNQQLLASLMDFYENFSAEGLFRLEDIYTPDIEFVDPVHKVEGILSLKHYLKKMATDLSHYRIRYIDVLTGDNSAYLTWEMDFGHGRLQGGEVITVRGMSHLKFTNRIYYHEDSYDLGALLYEHLPLLGRVTRALRHRLSGQAA